MKNWFRDVHRVALITLLVLINQLALADPGNALAAYRRDEVETANVELGKLEKLDDDPGVLVLLDELFVRYRERLPEDNRPPAELVRGIARLVEGGSPQAQYQIYDLGRDGPDAAQAVAFLERAAQAGYAEAQLDYLNAKRQGLTGAERLDLLIKAANGDSLRAKLILAGRYRESTAFDRVTKRSSVVPTDEARLIAADSRRSFSLYLTVAQSIARPIYPDDEAAIRRGRVAVASAYYNGIGVERDDKEAFRWANASVASNEPDAAKLLWQMYLNGRGVPKDIDKARYWCREYAKTFKSSGGLWLRCDEQVPDEIIKQRNK